MKRHTPINNLDTRHYRFDRRQSRQLAAAPWAKESLFDDVRTLLRWPPIRYGAAIWAVLLLLAWGFA